MTAQPVFFWRGILICLPVALLAGIGGYGLRQDRLLAEREAREHAQTLSDNLADKIWALVTTVDTNAGSGQGVEGGSPAGTVVFQIDSAGQLIYPPALTNPPVPWTPDLSLLTPRQQELWDRARAAEYREPAAEPAWNRLLAEPPPGFFAASAEYALGLAAVRNRDYEKARNHFSRVGSQYGSLASESGLPFGALAHLQLLRVAKADGESPANLEDICAQAVWQPSILTSPILSAAAEIAVRNPAETNNSAVHWQRLWETHQQARDLYHAWRGPAILAGQQRDTAILAVRQRDTAILAVQPGVSNAPAVSRPGNSETWRGSWLTQEEAWLILENPGNGWVTAHSATRLHPLIRGLVARTAKVPDYFSVQVTALDRPVFPLRTGNREAPDPREYVSATRPEGGGAILRAALRLEFPGQLHAAQRRRAWWFGGVVAVSALAALVGLASAWQAFQRQGRLNLMKSNFVSSVSHELRAPIASIRLMAEGLARGRVNSEAKKTEYFQFMVQECRRLGAMIENVLDFSRIDQGRKRYELEATDLRGLVEHTARLMEPNAAERHLRIKLVVAPEATGGQNSANSDHWQAYVDGKAIQQALINLLDNAIKHSPLDAEITVGLEVEALAIQGRQFTLWVEDRGPGIPLAEQERIFEWFYRCGSELRRETPGAGIGLSIVKHIVDGHGGRITVCSASGAGCRFAIALPEKPAKPG